MSRLPKGMHPRRFSIPIPFYPPKRDRDEGIDYPLLSRVRDSLIPFYPVFVNMNKILACRRNYVGVYLKVEYCGILRYFRIIERDRDGKRDRNGIKRGIGIKRDKRGMGLSIPIPLWL
jgi:hypothetical protein